MEMALLTRLEGDLKASIKSGEAVKKQTLRMALTEVKLGSVSQGRPLNDEEILRVLRKQIQIRQETIADASRANRTDLVEESEAEIAVLKESLPAPFPQEELERLAREAIIEVGAESISDAGKVMKVLMPRLEGRVPGGEANQAVRELLAQDG
jgi:uncharacterized protein YqeY